MQPVTLEERLLHIAEAKRTLGTTIPWIADTMSNDVKHAMGNSPNSEFIIGPDGKIVVMRDWSNPDTLRADLARLVGEVPNPTRVADLDLQTDKSRPRAARGVVPRLQRSDRMQPVRVDAKSDDQNPIYIKLRAEADSNLMDLGYGQLYVGLHIDPIHHVHWNNLNDAVFIEIETSDGVTVEPTTWEAPKPDVDSDVDPREFLVEVGAKSSNHPILFTVYAFVCDDAETWCKAVKQTYAVTLDRDRDAGSAMRRGGFGRGGFGRDGLCGGRGRWPRGRHKVYIGSRFR